MHRNQPTIDRDKFSIFIMHVAGIQMVVIYAHVICNVVSTQENPIASLHVRKSIVKMKICPIEN